MGIVNVTPDSFSDGGAYASAADAAATARRMLEDGAAIVDVGGESTRPGAADVSEDEELRRVVPVLERLQGCAVSIDTSRARVAREALGLGATMVNDVTALRREPELAEVVAEADVRLCLMHMQGEPRTMQEAPHYRDVVATVVEISDGRAYHLLEALAVALADTLIERFPVSGVRVRVRKPDVELARPVEHTAVRVERRVSAS